MIPLEWIVKFTRKMDKKNYSTREKQTERERGNENLFKLFSSFNFLMNEKCVQL